MWALTLSEQNELYTLLKAYGDLFEATLGHWTGKPYQINLKPGVKPSMAGRTQYQKCMNAQQKWKSSNYVTWVS